MEVEKRPVGGGDPMRLVHSVNRVALTLTISAELEIKERSKGLELEGNSWRPVTCERKQTTH